MYREGNGLILKVRISIRDAHAIEQEDTVLCRSVYSRANLFGDYRLFTDFTSLI